MDHLDQVAELAGTLLARVDEVLSRAGAPPGHPVWPPLRRVGLLPGPAVAAVTALNPDTIEAAAPRLRALGRDVDAAARSLPLPDPWSGEAADAYDATRRRLATDLADGPGSLTEKVAATVRFADAVAAWMRSSRRAVAATLTEVLTSSEALSVLTDDTGPVPPAHEAAAIAERVLRTVAEVYEDAEALIAPGPGVPSR
jgi:hypothetical protein